MRWIRRWWRAGSRWIDDELEHRRRTIDADWDEAVGERDDDRERDEAVGERDDDRESLWRALRRRIAEGEAERRRQIEEEGYPGGWS